MPAASKPRNQQRRQWDDMNQLAAFKKSLKKGFKLDVFDTASVPPQWMEAEVTAVHRSSIDVHYVGWSEKYDTTIDSSEYKQRIAAMGSYSEEVVHYSCCMLCDEGGDNRTLVCCDGCPRVVHLQCVKLKSLPRGDYFCPDCIKHKREKRVMKDRRDVSQYEEEEDEPDDEEEERVAEREKENRTNRAGSRGAAAPVRGGGSNASKSAARFASPAAPVAPTASATESRQSESRPSDRRALATKAGRTSLGSEAGLRPTMQREASKEMDSGDEVTEDTERKEQLPPTRKRSRNDSSSTEQATHSSSRSATASSPTSTPSRASAVPAPVTPPAPLPPIHLAAGVSYAANESSRKRVRANSSAQQQQQQQQQQQPQNDSTSVSSLAGSGEEKKEPSVDSKKPAVGNLGNFVDCYRHQATHRGKSFSTSSSSSASSFIADGLPAVGIPPFSFPPSNFDESSADTYIAHFCTLLDMAGDKVSLNVPSELPGVERWKRLRDKMEEVGDWMTKKCNQQINGEQDVVHNAHQLIARQTQQWKEQLDLYELQLRATTQQRKAAVVEIVALDRQIEQLKQQREQKTRDMEQKQHELDQLNADKESAKREFDRKVAEQEANVKKAAQRVRMLRDLSEHVASRREEGDDKEQSGQYWEPLDTIRRRCAAMTSGMRLREADRSNSSGSQRREEEKEVEAKRPADEQKEESKTAPHHIAAALESCVDAATNAFVDQSLRHTQSRDVYERNSFTDTFDDEAAVEMHSADIATPLDEHSSVFLSNVRLSSASFGSLSSLSSLSSAGTISEVPQVVLSSSDESVSSTQTTLALSPARGEGAAETWEAERLQQHRMEVMEEEKEESKQADGAIGMVEADEALPASTALNDLSGVRRLSGENMEELTAVAEEQLTPEKRVSLSAASGSMEQDGGGDAAGSACGDTDSAGGSGSSG